MSERLLDFFQSFLFSTHKSFQLVENYSFNMLNIFSCTSIIENGHTACQFKD